MKDVMNAIYKDFRETYPFVSIGKEVVEAFYVRFKSTRVDLLLDYIISQGLEEDMEL